MTTIAPLFDVLDGTEAFMRRAAEVIPSQRPADVPALPDPATRESRLSFLVGPTGEVGEYIAAEARDDLPQIVDGLWDSIVVELGTLLKYIGRDATIATGLAIVASNWAKVVDGVIVGPNDKVMKPEGWQAPDIEGILRAHGWKG